MRKKTSATEVDFGDKVRDRLTGYEGTITARYEYENGCVRYMVEAKNTSDGGVHELVFDEDRIEHVSGEKVEKRGGTGGPRHAPPRTGAA